MTSAASHIDAIAKMSEDDLSLWMDLNKLLTRFNIPKTAIQGSVPFIDNKIDWEFIEQRFVLNLAQRKTFESLTHLLTTFPKFNSARATRFLREKVESNEVEIEWFEFFVFLISARVTNEVRTVALMAACDSPGVLDSYYFRELQATFPKLFDADFMSELTSGVTL